MNYQKMRIDFTQKRGLTAPFVYKTGEIDVDGIEAELVNIDVDGSPIGFIKLVSPTGIERESALRIENGFAYFDIPKNEEGLYTVELTILNKKNKTRSGNIAIEVINSLSYDSEEYETLLDTITQHDAEYTSNENTRKSNESTRVSNENTRISNEIKRQASITDIEKRFSSLTTAQQQQAEVADSRTDYNGVVHANLKTRLDNDYKTLASLIPTDIAFDGYESVTTNDTLSGDVKNTTLTGQTLVNVVGTGLNLKFVKASTKYTVLVTSSVAETATLSHDTTTIFSSFKQGVNIATYTTTSTPSLALTRTGSAVLTNLIVLEGDHTDKPLEFFEGLKSAEVSEVTSHGVNLVDINDHYSNRTGFVSIDEHTIELLASSYNGYPIIKNPKPNTRYCFGFNYEKVSGTSGTLAYTIKYSDGTSINGRAYTSGERIITGSGVISCIGIYVQTQVNRMWNMFVYEVTPNTPSTYVPYQSSKVTLSEPITLRSLPNGVADTYDVDTGVLTRRCGERAYIIDDETNADMFTDLTRTVYKLAKSTTEYIENNGQLRSYDYQTTVSADSIVPVKLNGNIPVNYASTLANLATQARELKLENIALIEQAETLEQQLLVANETNDYQDELIDVSLMATDELYVMLEPLLENVTQQMSTKDTRNVSDETTKDTQGGNAMVDAYVAMVIRGLKTIDEVPSRYREEVKRVLAELEK